MSITTAEIDAAIALLNSLPMGRKAQILRTSGLAVNASDVEVRSFFAGKDALPSALIPRSPLSDAQAKAKTAIEKMYLIKTTDVGAKCQTAFGIAQCDDAYPLNSRSTITGAVVMATVALQSRSPFAQSWTMVDNTQVVMDSAQMIQFGVEVGQFIARCFDHKTTLKASVAAATTVQEVSAIDISTGWPS